MKIAFFNVSGHMYMVKGVIFRKYYFVAHVAYLSLNESLVKKLTSKKSYFRESRLAITQHFGKKKKKKFD